MATEESDERSEDEAPAEADHHQPIRHIQPMGMRVLVRLLPSSDRSPGGLYLPQGVSQTKEEALYGEVVEVARATGDEASLGENVSGVPAGAYVLFPVEAGVRVPWDNDLRIIETKDILATVEEVQYGEAH